MAQHKSPRFAHCSSTIKAHRPFCSKHAYWSNKVRVLIESRNDFLGHQRTRRHMMGPSQAVDVACQAFTPMGTDLVGNKMVEPTTRWDMPLWEHAGPGVSAL